MALTIPVVSSDECLLYEMTAAARGEVFPLPRPEPVDLPHGRNAP
jgi:hypothetical protein